MPLLVDTNKHSICIGFYTFVPPGSGSGEGDKSHFPAQLQVFQIPLFNSKFFKILFPVAAVFHWQNPSSDAANPIPSWRRKGESQFSLNLFRTLLYPKLVLYHTVNGSRNF